VKTVVVPESDRRVLQRRARSKGAPARDMVDAAGRTVTAPLDAVAFGMRLQQVTA
jgi:hypothetical protein